MTGRQRSIVLLLGSLHDYLPALGSSLNPTTGMAAIERRPCTECGHTATRGWVTDAFKRRRPCRSCGGQAEPSGAHGQWVAKDRGRGWVYVDPMDVLERPVQTSTEAAPPTRAARVVSCDACSGSGTGKPHLRDLTDPLSEYRDPCEHCGGSGKREVTRFDLQVEREARDVDPIEKRAEEGSYRELDRALGAETAYGRRLVLEVHGPNPSRAIESLWAAEALALRFVMSHLDKAMPDPIRVPGAVRAAAKREAEHGKQIRGRALNPHQRGQQDKEIRKLIRLGRPVQWVAREYGLTPRRVYQIINGEQEAA